jgi:DNA-binding NarL/FixJ family response regulator
MISIAIVDDHPMVREGLEAMLMSDGAFNVVALAANGAEALEVLPKSSVDVVLSDVRMPRMDGFAMLEHLRKLMPGVKVVFLAGMPLKEEEARARREGAAGYLPKDVDQDRLSTVIKAIAAGEESFATEQFQAAPSILTMREMDVLRLLAQGNQRDQIATQLGIGAESVKTHLKGIMTKLNCPNATSAVGRAYELGILRA